MNMYEHIHTVLYIVNILSLAITSMPLAVTAPHTTCNSLFPHTPSGYNYPWALIAPPVAVMTSIAVPHPRANKPAHWTCSCGLGAGSLLLRF